MSIGRMALIAGLTCVVMGSAAERASADASAMAKRLPGGANVVAYIDVESILNSKLGAKEGWRARMKETYASTPLIVPPSAQHVLMASWLEPSGMEPMWEVSLIELKTTPSLERIARDEKGFTESFGDKLAAWTPTNAYFVRMDSKLLGVVSPADRQFAARWSAKGGDGLSPFLQSAVSKVDAKTSYLFAIDLGDMVSEKRFRRRLAMDEIACLEGKEFDINKFCDVLTSVKGLKLVVHVGDDISGDCTVEFGKPVADLGAHAKPLLLEFLDKSGAGIDDFHGWKETAKGSAIHLSGKLTPVGFKRLLSVVDPPCPGECEERSGSPEPSDKGPASPATIAAASQKYYRAVADILDGMGEQVTKSNSLNKGATFIARDARRISRVPLLNVDPELAQWGAGVSTRLLQVASSLGVGGFNARAGASSIQESMVNTGFNDPYSYGAIRPDPNDEVNRRNANRQRAAASAQARADALREITQVLQEIEASRGTIRASMTQKHKVDF